MFDLGTRTKEQWDKDHPGDNGSGDMNRNGITDLAEYLSGKDPASCVWDDVDIVHVETTVYHQAVLKNCLADAGMDLRHNVIRVARGTYAGNFSYVTAWGEAFDLSLVGGYDPAGGAGRTADPALTALTGDTDNDGAGNGVVLLIDTDTSKTPGTVHVESLTFRNGMAPAGQNGGGIQARIYQGSLELVGNIFRDNSADGGGGLSVDSSDSGQILLINNILYTNNAATAAAARISTAASGPVTLLNNTFAGNTATSTDGYGRTLMVQSTAAAVDLTNNIIAGVPAAPGARSTSTAPATQYRSSSRTMLTISRAACMSTHRTSSMTAATSAPRRSSWRLLREITASARPLPASTRGRPMRKCRQRMLTAQTGYPAAAWTVARTNSTTS